MLTIPPTPPLSQYYEALKAPITCFPSQTTPNIFYPTSVAQNTYQTKSQYLQYPPQTINATPVTAIPPNPPTITPKIAPPITSPNTSPLPAISAPNQTLISNPKPFVSSQMHNHQLNPFSSSVGQYQPTSYIPLHQVPVKFPQSNPPSYQYQSSQQYFPKVTYSAVLSPSQNEIINKAAGNRTPWSIDEDEILSQMYEKIGPQWATIAELLPGRSISEIRSRRNAIESRKRQRQKSALKHLRLATEYQRKQQVINETCRKYGNSQNLSSFNPPSNYSVPIKQAASQPIPAVSGETTQSKTAFDLSINSLLN